MVQNGVDGRYGSVYAVLEVMQFARFLRFKQKTFYGLSDIVTILDSVHILRYVDPCAGLWENSQPGRYSFSSSIVE